MDDSSRDRAARDSPFTEPENLGALLRTVETDLQLVLWMIDLRSEEVVYASPAYEAMWGRSRAGLIENPRDWMEALLPEHRPGVNAAFEALLRGEPYDMEYRIQRPDGTRRWIHARGARVVGSASPPTHVVGICRDVTEERKIQAELRGARLAVAHAEERERRTLAADLHDSVGQILPLALVKLDALGEKADPRLGEAVAELRGLLGQAEEDIRTLTFRLAPVALEEDGFAASVRRLAALMRDRYGLGVVVHGDDLEDALVGDRAAVLLRGVRELLINVSRHAHTDMAEVRIAREGRSAVVTVEDHGVGATADRLEGFGLLALRERMRAVGGRLEIDSRPGRGTRVRLVLPPPARGSRPERMTGR